MHYSLVNNKKNDVDHHVNTRPLDSQKPRRFVNLKKELFLSIKKTFFRKLIF